MKKTWLDGFFEDLMKQNHAKHAASDFVNTYHLEKPDGEMQIERIGISDDVELCYMNVENRVFTHYNSDASAPEMIEFGFCFSGSIEIWLDEEGGPMTLRAGDVFVYRFQNHFEKIRFAHHNSQTLSISFGGELLKNRAVSDGCEEKWKCFVETMFEKNHGLRIFPATPDMVLKSKALREAPLSDWVEFLGVKVRVLELMTSMITEGTTNCAMASKPDLVQLVTSKVKGDISAQYPLDVLSRQCHCSIHKLQCAFKKETGMTVYHYIKALKMEAAANLLIHTDLSVMTIAGEVGYENASKFSKAFAEVMGETPSVYRQTHECHP